MWFLVLKGFYSLKGLKNFEMSETKSPSKVRTVSTEEQNARNLRKRAFIDETHEFTTLLKAVFDAEMKLLSDRQKLERMMGKNSLLRMIHNAFRDSMYNESEKKRFVEKKKKEKTAQATPVTQKQTPTASSSSAADKLFKKPKSLKKSKASESTTASPSGTPREEELDMVN